MRAEPKRSNTITTDGTLPDLAECLTVHFDENPIERHLVPFSINTST